MAFMLPLGVISLTVRRPDSRLARGVLAMVVVVVAAEEEEVVKVVLVVVVVAEEEVAEEEEVAVTAVAVAAAMAAATTAARIPRPGLLITKYWIIYVLQIKSFSYEERSPTHPARYTNVNKI